LEPPPELPQAASTTAASTAATAASTTRVFLVKSIFPIDFVDKASAQE
jgi:hypothetical protein